MTGINSDKGLLEKIFTAIGEASMCWDPIPSGVFDSSRAKRIGDKLLSDITPVPSDEGLREAVEWLLSLVRESEGVSGYHKNGDLAPWSEFDCELNSAGDALSRYLSRPPCHNSDALVAELRDRIKKKSYSDHADECQTELIPVYEIDEVLRKYEGAR